MIRSKIKGWPRLTGWHDGETRSENRIIRSYTFFTIPLIRRFSQFHLSILFSIFLAILSIPDDEVSNSSRHWCHLFKITSRQVKSSTSCRTWYIHQESIFNVNVPGYHRVIDKSCFCHILTAVIHSKPRFLTLPSWFLIKLKIVKSRITRFWMVNFFLKSNLKNFTNVEK